MRSRTSWATALAIVLAATGCTEQEEAGPPTAVPSVAGTSPAAADSPASEDPPTSPPSSPSPSPAPLFVEVRGDLVPPAGVELGPGSCTPARVRFPHPVDCRFPIVEGEPAALEGWAVARLRDPTEPPSDVPDALRSSRSETCIVEGRDLVCPRLEPESVSTSSPITLPVAVAVGETPVDTGATVTVLPDVDSPAVALVAGSYATNAVAGTVTGAPTPISITRGTADGPVWLLVRTWPEQETLVSAIGLGAGVDEAWVELTVNEPGEHEVVVCAGPDPGQCEADVSGSRLLVVDPRLEPLVARHNGPDDRIDVVITGRGFPSHADFVDAARILFDPEALPMLEVGQGPPTLRMPVFAIEPLRSRADRFNLWVLPHPFTPLAFDPLCGNRWDDPVCPDDQTTRPLAHSVLGPEEITFVELEGLPPVDIVARRGVAPGGATAAFSRQDPDWSLGPPTPPTSRDDWTLGPYAEIAVEIGRPWTSDHLTSHEIGHSWFGFGEEYGGPDVLGEGTSPDARPGPGCTSSVELATSWWGDLLGEVDPFAEEVAALLRAGGVPGPDVVELARIDIVPGCDAGVKASASSIMEDRFDGIPVYNTVNRRWVEAILDLWG